MITLVIRTCKMKQLPLEALVSKELLLLELKCCSAVVNLQLPSSLSHLHPAYLTQGGTAFSSLRPRYFRRAFRMLRVWAFTSRTSSCRNASKPRLFTAPLRQPMTQRSFSQLSLTHRLQHILSLHCPNCSTRTRLSWTSSQFQPSGHVPSPYRQHSRT